MSILLSVDVEASGPAPLHGDMISFAAVIIEEGLGRTFECPLQLATLPQQFSPRANVSGIAPVLP